MVDQSQQSQPQPQQQDPMVVVINAAVQVVMNYQQANCQLDTGRARPSVWERTTSLIYYT